MLGITDQTESQPLQNSDAVATPRLEIAVFRLPLCTRPARTLDLPHQVDTVNGDDDFGRWQSRSGMTTFPQVLWMDS